MAVLEYGGACVVCDQGLDPRQLQQRASWVDFRYNGLSSLKFNLGAHAFGGGGGGVGGGDAQGGGGGRVPVYIELGGAGGGGGEERPLFHG